MTGPRQPAAREEILPTFTAALVCAAQKASRNN
jgi:hypothetical protein